MSTQLQSLLSPATRTAVAFAMAGLVAVAWVEAGKSSEHAVQLAGQAMARTYVVLPTVEIVAKRESAAPALTAQAAQRATGS